jgi:hypothetical protein
MAELEAGAFALEQKLELPHFLGGALVGMGLVGTFIGLLGTLEDLSTVFSALVNPSISTMSPTQMFSDMVTKLQAPMQGMGTAFVASLYGLLGSLLVTLMMVSARKTIASTLHHIHAVVRQLDYGARRPVQHTAWAAAGLDDTIQPAPDGLDTLRWLKVLQTSVEDLTRQVTAHQAQQDLIARQMTHLVQELLTAGQTTAASQVKTEQVIRQMLHQADQDTDSDTSPPQNKP